MRLFNPFNTGVGDLQNLTDVTIQKNVSLGTPYATKGIRFAAYEMHFDCCCIHWYFW